MTCGSQKVSEKATAATFWKDSMAQNIKKGKKLRVTSSGKKVNSDRDLCRTVEYVVVGIETKYYFLRLMVLLLDLY